MTRSLKWILLLLFFAQPALAATPAELEIKLKAILSAPLNKGAGTFANPADLARLQTFLTANPKMVNQPILEIGGEDVSTPLVEALKKGNLDAARILLESKANPNTALGRWPVKPLEAAMTDRLSDAVKLAQIRLLLARGADAKMALHFWAACRPWQDRKSYLFAVDALVAAKAGVNATDDVGATPLQVAVTSDNLLAVQELLSMGAKVDDAILKSAEAGKKSPEGAQILKLIKAAPKPSAF